MRIDKTITIQAEPSKVFLWLAPHRMPLWDPHVERATGSLGGRFALVARTLGHRFEMAAEATAVEWGRRFAWRQVDGDFERNEGEWRLSGVPTGTRVRLIADLDLPYVLPRVATEAEVRRALSGQLDDALLALKERVEQGARGAA